MPITDYEATVANAQAQIAVEDTSPIDGSGSYRFTRTATYTNNMTLRRTTPAESHLDSGIYQAAFQADAGGAAGGAPAPYGIYFLLRDNTTGITNNEFNGNEWYEACYNPAGAGQFEVRKGTPNLGQPGTTLAFAPGPTVVAGTPFTMRLEWRQHAAAEGGVRTILKIGTALDYSDMAGITPIIDFVHPTAAAIMTPSQGTGFFQKSRETTSVPSVVLIDRIEGFSNTL